MGLTIHYSLKTRGSEARSHRLAHTQHERARDLPFQELGCLHRVHGEGSFWEKRDLPVHNGNKGAKPAFVKPIQRL